MNPRKAFEQALGAQKVAGLKDTLDKQLAKQQGVKRYKGQGDITAGTLVTAVGGAMGLFIGVGENNVIHIVWADNKGHFTPAKLKASVNKL